MQEQRHLGVEPRTFRLGNGRSNPLSQKRNCADFSVTKCILYLKPLFKQLAANCISWSEQKGRNRCAAVDGWGGFLTALRRQDLRDSVQLCSP